MALVAILTTAVLSLAPVPKPPDPVPSNSAPTGGASTRSSSPQPPLVVPPGAPGLASWYPARPSACWDARGRHSLPAGIVAFTAARGLPCGTMVTVSGPAGSITVPVEDFGPEGWTGRALDLSPGAFIAVAGNLWTGVVPVSWRAAA